jgi:thioredoxin-related protein
VRYGRWRHIRALAALAALILPASVASAAQETPPPTPTKAVRSPGNATWAATHAEATARALDEKKLVFVEFDGAACGPCKRMDSLLYAGFDFEALLISMVPVKVLLDSPDGKKLAERYGIREIPAILVTSPEGRLVFQMEGFLNPQDFYPHIRKDLDAYRDFSRKVDAQNVPTLPAAEALATGRELYQRSDSRAAEPRLVRAASSPGATAEIRDTARELLAAVQQDLGRIAASRETIEKLIATTKDPVRRERAELFRAELPLAENKPSEAYVLFKKFQHDHPQSTFRSQVEAMLSRLEAARPQ